MTDIKSTNPTSAADGVEFEPIDRGSFLLKGALAAGAIYGAGSIAPLVGRAFAQGGDEGDIEILNFALTLEYLEADFYRQALDALDLRATLKEYAQEFGANEADHVDALKATITDLGGEPAKEPKFEFGLSDEDAFVELAVTLEDTGVQAYNGAAPGLRSKELLSTAGAIAQIEARHAGALRFEQGRQPVVDAFDSTLSMDEVLEAVEPFIRS